MTEGQGGWLGCPVAHKDSLGSATRSSITISRAWSLVRSQIGGPPQTVSNGRLGWPGEKQAELDPRGPFTVSCTAKQLTSELGILGCELLQKSSWEHGVYFFSYTSTCWSFRE